MMEAWTERVPDARMFFRERTTTPQMQRGDRSQMTLAGFAGRMERVARMERSAIRDPYRHRQLHDAVGPSRITLSLHPATNAHGFFFRCAQLALRLGPAP